MRETETMAPSLSLRADHTTIVICSARLVMQSLLMHGTPGKRFPHIAPHVVWVAAGAFGHPVILRYVASRRRVEHDGLHASRNTQSNRGISGTRVDTQFAPKVLGFFPALAWYVPA